MYGITIVGGGIAGLALAAALDADRFHVTVHEQRNTLPTVETSLAMWPEAQQALDAVGILPEIQAAGSAFSAMALRDVAGKAWFRAEAAGVIGVSRADLLRLLDFVVPDSVSRVPGAVTSLPDAGLLVGADGVHSVVRRQRWGPRSAERLSPYLALRGIVDEPVPADAGGEYWGRGELFGIAPASRERTYWYASYRSALGPGGIDIEAALDLTRRRFSGKAQGIDRVLAGAAPEGTLAQRIWTVPALRRYTRDGTVLVGDAAHGMTPNLGRGACEALVDSVTLAGLLNSRPLPEALKAYNKRRVLRSQALRAASSAMTRLVLAESAQPLRDRILSMAGRLRRSA
ncbi:FAD-binding monooxygenase [Arthrobacter sp. SPG23]|uniref:FAD-dependent monooxygenase n=1 Tax=Arthrobacter sp. SPG23 TaxID=1610703 RepID=UPI0005BD14B5|nr:FAD-dependent monooxygenase [Arthrobacter sp. SPG23]KIS25504.1 FAD-binding monooxygenase [Arthrobacter sp. SPG23]